MDVDDHFRRTVDSYRVMKCKCVEEPISPRRGYGCLCPSCGAQCRECIGYGYVEVPVKRVHQILSTIRSRIRRIGRTRGRPPGFVRLTELDVETLLRKWKDEEPDHWIRGYVDPGPPVRVYDVIVVIDRRRE